VPAEGFYILSPAQYIEEGKHTLTIAIGCTGGRHRSVTVAKALTDFILSQGHSAQNINRDIEKG
jgi:UPF0042 nucleotide-binding protein